ncbi:hypothetical protein QWY86_00815 [Pedobacter aquatilis]|uniref:hypothetical protein n=1 Tax=Pedobacter aquatilis TaxID=351343 RepID=UPI0025B629D8|nr:hypothetical protein [Pedobacter aquatilis]MDN3585189.1 hypothetical protein [Pedobacter aquatilis]
MSISVFMAGYVPAIACSLARSSLRATWRYRVYVQSSVQKKNVNICINRNDDSPDINENTFGCRYYKIRNTLTPKECNIGGNNLT